MGWVYVRGRCAFSDFLLRVLASLLSLTRGSAGAPCVEGKDTGAKARWLICHSSSLFRPLGVQRPGVAEEEAEERLPSRLAARRGQRGKGCVGRAKREAEEDGAPSPPARARGT